MRSAKVPTHGMGFYDGSNISHIRYSLRLNNSYPVICVKVLCVPTHGVGNLPNVLTSSESHNKTDVLQK